MPPKEAQGPRHTEQYTIHIFLHLMVDILGTLNTFDQESEMPNSDYDHFCSVFHFQQLSTLWPH